MADPLGILLLDDGELVELSSLLTELGLPHERLRGGEIPDALDPPSDLLVVTARRARVVRPQSESGARHGGPLRIVAVSEDSTAMRQMLRQLGFSLLVRLPTHRSIWRLLLQRTFYQGDERRTEERVPLGSPVSISGGVNAATTAAPEVVLVDISNRGCRLMAPTPFLPGAHARIELPSKVTRGEPLTLSGRLVRTASERDANGELQHSAALCFDASLADADRGRLGSVINRWSMGPDSISADAPGQAVLPPVESTSIPGLTLDDETDPAIRMGEPIALLTDGDAADPSDRRGRTRGTYEGPVDASSEGRRLVLMGRDLSAGGMRIERLPDLEVGDRLRLALYGPSAGDPFRVTASVVRDDGENGLALAFEQLSPETADALEKLVACLPEVESLEAGEARGLGAVLSEVLDGD